MIKSKKIIILGSGQTLSMYKFKQGDIVWCPLSMKCKPIDKIKPLYWGMHWFQSSNGNDIMDLRKYPITKISKKYKSCFFTNTVSYMLAYALYTGIQEIDIYGVDMNGDSEYVNQRHSVMYWIGYLRANGVKVDLKNDLDKPPFIYGYENGQSLITKIDAMIKHAEINNIDSLPDDQKNQLIGFTHALKSIRKEI